MAVTGEARNTAVRFRVRGVVVVMVGVVVATGQASETSTEWI